ncbi:MAG: uroporphyrinogen-III C-methyltransferase [Opitutales bacterium]
MVAPSFPFRFRTNSAYRPRPRDASPPAGPGRVYLVGAGPGDPELLTMKAHRLLAEAEVLVHDHLVSAEVLALVHPDCTRVFVGKKGGGFHCPQGEIEGLLVHFARRGKKVVRLKGGDPFVFGRGGEEAEALAAAGIPFEIVPGVTAALGAAASTGIPLTHRAHSSAVVFLTGHEDPSKEHSTVNWADYARLGATLCVYMGVRHLPRITAGLLAGGLAGDTPAAIIQAACTADQQLYLTTLADLPACAFREQVEAPALVIIGQVVSLAETLAWVQADGTGHMSAAAEARR